MLLDVGLQHRVEVLELSVSDDADNVYLTDRREQQTLSHTFTTPGIHKAGTNSSDSCLFGEVRMGGQEDVRLDIIAHQQSVKKKRLAARQGQEC